MNVTPAAPPFVCPACRTELEPAAAGALRCPADGAVYPEVDGIRRLLSPARQAELEGFLTRYAAVRRDEGWGSEEADYYLALPFRDLSGRHPEIWRVRAVSYRVFRRRVLRPLARRRGPLRVLDLGAGNGWLAHRLSLEGHRPVALDVTVDPRDGLGACRHYRASFPRVQASFDELPWADGAFDLVVFNGSLHYSRDYRATLRESRRLVGAGGRLAVMDTPIYRRSASGAEMLRELEGRLAERYGSTGPFHEGYLTLERLESLGREAGLEWRVIRPFYGPRWALLPWKARLLGRREPMRFYVLVGTPRHAIC